MRLLTFARFVIWSAFVGSLLIFLVSPVVPYSGNIYEGAYQVYGYIRESSMILFGRTSIPQVTLGQANEFANRMDEGFGHVSAAWHLITALLIAIGATSARYVYKVDKRLNDDWYWVSKTEENGHLLRLAKGTMKIDNIHRFNKRQKEPQAIINGKMTGFADLEGQNVVDPNNRFQATHIVVGRDHSHTLFFQWEYVDGIIATGITRLNFLEQQASLWQRVCGRSSLVLRGTFMLDSSVGGGTMSYYAQKGDANADYDLGLTRFGLHSETTIVEQFPDAA